MKKTVIIELLILLFSVTLIAEGNTEYTTMDKDGIAPPRINSGEEYIKPSKKNLKHKLTSLQFNVTQMDGTEQSFNNLYWDNHEDGIYVDIVSGEPLFSSLDKYDSRTGWPSFIKPLIKENVILKKDSSYGMVRVEVRSLYADSHLGHLFTDGPEPLRDRYCINSASLRFIAVKDLETQGYGNYLSLFKTRIMEE